MTRRTPILSAVLLLVGCGEPLVDGSYRGEAMLTVSGIISVSDPEVQASLDGGAPVRLAVFWASNPTNMTNASDTVSGVEQRVEVSQASVLRYSVTLFTPPPSSVLRRPLLGSGTAAIGQLIAYADDNGNGRWEPGVDQLLGGIQNIVLAYSPDGASGAMFPTPLKAGYHVLGAADCAPELGVRTLLPVVADTQHPLVLVRHGVPSLYVDLNCDGTGNEWLPSNCPPPEELDNLCLHEGDPATNEPSHDELCSLCLALDIYGTCETKLGECGDTWPELCEPYQRCIDEQWVPDPFLICDYEFVTCGGPNSPPADAADTVCHEALEKCLASGHCSYERYNCESSGAPACDQAFDDCVASATM